MYRSLLSLSSFIFVKPIRSTFDPTYTCRIIVHGCLLGHHSSIVSSVILSSSGYRMQYTLPLTSGSRLVSILLHTPCGTDPVKPDPVDVFSLPSENLSNLVPGEYFNFFRLVFGLPSVIFTYPANFFSCLGKGKRATLRKRIRN